jgi:hypothetical protein
MQRLVLSNQVVAFRLHFLYLVVVLGESSIQLGLQQGGVFSGLIELLL